LADVKRISGSFTGMYAVHPFTGQEIPIWVADYVLAGYGTGAVMAVPAHDSRDFAFAKHFDLPILPVVAIPQGHDLNTESYDAKEGKLTNSDFLNGLDVKDAIKKAIEYIEKRNIGKGKTNFRLRDAIFGRQRYWGEPIPVYYKNGIPYCLPEDKLPLELPAIDKFLPTEDGEPPLARAEKWMWDETKQEVSTEGFPIETTTMPGWAGSSWYFLRYMDPTNQHAFASKEAVEYWKNVDLYLGGSEHATGHLLYVRFWTKFLYDRGFIPVNEPAQKLINQGMIQGRSNKISRLEYGYHGAPLGDQSSVLRRNIYVTKEIGEKIENGDLSDVESFLTEIINKDNPGSNGTAHPFNIRINRLNVDVNIVKNDLVSLNDFRNSITGSKDAVFLGATDDKIECSWEVEKMSKSKYNIVTPDNIVEDYGADTLRLYEMFLGPLEQSKPWSTQGIEGVHRFLKKLWKLFYNQEGNFIVSTEVADKKELKVLHKLIKKVGEDIENFSFNTSVPAFMICVNELIELKSSKKEILENVVICLSPYAPHIAEELWAALGNKDSVFNAQFPIFNAQFLVEDTFSYPISINGKHRMNMEMSLTLTQPEVEQLVLADEGVQKWLEGKTPKKIIFVKGKIVNMVL
jgi:leucyl-tRNA synthetase